MSYLLKYLFLVLTSGPVSFILLLFSVILIFLFSNKIIGDSIEAKLIVFALLGFITGAIIKPAHEFYLSLREHKNNPTTNSEFDAMAPSLIDFREKEAKIILGSTILLGLVALFYIVVF